MVRIINVMASCGGNIASKMVEKAEMFCIWMLFGFQRWSSRRLSNIDLLAMPLCHQIWLKTVLFDCSIVSWETTVGSFLKRLHQYAALPIYSCHATIIKTLL